MRADIVMARTAIALAAWAGRDRGDRRRTSGRRGPARAAAPAPAQPVRRARPRRGQARRGAARTPATRTRARAGPDGPGPDGPGPDGPATARTAAPADGPDRRPGRRRPGRSAARASPDAGDTRAAQQARRRGRRPRRAAAGRAAAEPFRTRLLERARARRGRGRAAGPRARTEHGRTTGARGPQGRADAAAPGGDRPRRRAAPAGARAAPAPGLRRPARTTCARRCARAARATSCCSSSTPRGSMAARQRMSAVKGAVLSLLLDAYQRRDKVGLVTFRGAGRRAGAAADLVGGGGRGPAGRRCRPAAAPRWPPGCCGPHEVLRVERLRDPAAAPAARRRHRRPGHRRPRRRSRWPAAPRGAAARRATGTAVGGRRLRVAGRCGWAWPGALARASCGATPLATLDELARPSVDCAGRGPGRTGTQEGGLMPQGQPSVVPDDGLTTRQRRNRPLLVVHTGAGQGQVDRRVRAGAAGLEPGLADRGVPVRQVARSGRSARRRALRVLGDDRRGRHRSPGTRWARAGPGSSAAPSSTTPRRPREGWEQIKRDLAAETYRLLRARRVHLPDALGLGRRRRGRRRCCATGPAPSTSSSPAATPPATLVEVADLVTEMTKVKHPMDAGQKGQRGIEW